MNQSWFTLQINCKWKSLLGTEEGKRENRGVEGWICH
jgi:hypothetical protein